MEKLGQKTVAEFVAEDYRAADVFKKHKIDFCCKGKVSVAEICRKKKLDCAQIERELMALDEPVSNAHDFNSWELDFLADYIIQTHHKYVTENIPLILEYAEKVARVHGHHYTETVEINTFFKVVAQELQLHMQKEEHILFPFIKRIVQAARQQQPMPNPPFGSVQNPIRMMEMEHEDAGDIFKKIAVLTNGYQPPEGACNTFRVLYAKLKEFEEDLHQHIHLENNILFPKAIMLEQAK